MSEIIEIAKYLGYEPEEGKEITLDALKSHVQAKYVPIDHIPQRTELWEPIVKSKIGEVLGSTQTALVSHAKELGIEVTHNDYKDKGIKDVLPDLFGRVKAKLEEFKGKKPDEQLLAKLEQKEKEYQTLATDYSTKLQEFDGYRAQVADEKRQTAKKLIEQQAYSAVNFRTTATELEKTGFKATIAQKYDIEVAEDGTHYAVYRDGEKKGSRVPSPARADQFMRFDEVVKSEATALKLLADPREGRPAGGNGFTPQRQPDPNAGKPKNRIHPSALGR